MLCLDLRARKNRDGLLPPPPVWYAYDYMKMYTHLFYFTAELYEAIFGKYYFFSQETKNDMFIY